MSELQETRSKQTHVFEYSKNSTGNQALRTKPDLNATPMSELSYSYSEMLGGVGGTTAHTGLVELESSIHRRLSQGSYLKNNTTGQHFTIEEESIAKKSLAEIFKERKGMAAVAEDRPRATDGEIKREKTKEELAEIRKQMMKRPQRNGTTLSSASE